MTDRHYMHFHPDERGFADRATDWIERAAEQHQLKLTDFLDPRQAVILESLANRNPDVTFRLDGGYPEAERQRALIAPDYRALEDEPVGITVLSITSEDGKLAELQHGDYLGAILGLGIKRDKIGDIQIHEEGCHILVTEDIASYFHLQLQQVHRVHVQTELIPANKLRTATQKLDDMNISVASLRLDGIASDVYRLSRTKIVVPIQAGRCKVNWKVEENPSKMLKEGDVVSLQGFGRFKVLEVEGVTKKGRIRVKIGKYA
ncbi:RNA-binding protein S4 [Paenibacillus swuensis]|uniref:RNA-binding protein S4 n=1 Tax=Paenibacillus swuensis TaxID=1178515 RepID=A0A172TKD6_9BACL|nr:YlmH/Sll1252 family protein [Paenibacillus swuensis]ANE47384.1 RNA-binding protein S4 [Paenibacillus swuensis]